MTDPADFVRPPRLAAWLVDLFTSSEQAELIAGDLQEEFSQLASKSGIASARRWYWRQTARSIAHLAAMGFRLSPWSTAAIIIGGFLLHRFVSSLPDKLLRTATDTYLAYWSGHFKAYMLLATDGMLIAHLTVALFVGCVIALAARGREMIVTMALGFIFVALGAASSIMWVVRTGDLWLPVLICADSAAIVIGGILVRTRRARLAQSVAVKP